jgi:Zn finger protein HypA/HybF involved in hydrogenase expression
MPIIDFIKCDNCDGKFTVENSAENARCPGCNTRFKIIRDPGSGYPQKLEVTGTGDG